MTHTAFLVHGFNVKDSGQNTTDKLAPYLSFTGYRVVELDYFWTGLMGVRLCNKKIANVIAQMSHLAEGKVIAFGHSNGCAILQAASLFGANFDQLVFINPALNRRAKIGQNVKYIHVWHSPSDTVVKLAKYIPNHKWGSMGAVGYQGEDSRFFNYDKEDSKLWTGPEGESYSSRSHSDVFSDRNLGYFAPRMEYAIRHAEKYGTQWLPK